MICSMPASRVRQCFRHFIAVKTVASAPVADISPKKHASSDCFLEPTPDKASHAGFINSLYRHSFIIFAVSLLIIGAAAIKVGGNYWTAKHVVMKTANVKVAARPISGFNMTVPADQLQSKLQTITEQPVSLTVGTQTIPVHSDTIKSWLQITSNKNKTEYYIHVNEAAINPSLSKLANRFVKAPINQLTANEDGVNRVVAGGRNGTALSDPNILKVQSQQLAKTVMDGKGMQFNTPLVAVPFQSVTPAAYPKALIADISTKKMWAYQNGQQVNSWLISAGKPSTPTPVGQFKIYAKFTVQDMKGTNPDGTPYFQPHVRWISYFYQGSAVHGVYWHDRSWFGVNNSSHGCIGLPEDEAQWVFNWAPIGTPVIVHT